MRVPVGAFCYRLERRERVGGSVRMVPVERGADGIEVWRCPACGTTRASAGGHVESRLRELAAKREGK